MNEATDFFVHNSKINANYTFTNNRWVISILNTGKTRLHFGHSIIVVEGLNQNQLFVGQYDILANPSDIPLEGIISKIRSFEDSTYHIENYSEYPSTSRYVTKDKAFDMICSIKEDKIRVENGEKIKYNLIGKNSILSDETNGINCTDWSIEKLKIAGIDNMYGSKPKIASGVLTGNEKEIITDTYQTCRLF